MIDITDAVDLTVTRSTFGAEGVGCETVSIYVETKTAVNHGDWIRVKDVDGEVYTGIVVNPQLNLHSWPFQITALDPLSAKIRADFTPSGAKNGMAEGLGVLATISSLISSCGSSVSISGVSNFNFYYLADQDPYQWDLYIKQVLMIAKAKLSYNAANGTYNLTSARKDVVIKTPYAVSQSTSYEKYINHLTANVEAEWIDSTKLEEETLETIKNGVQTLTVKRKGGQILEWTEIGPEGYRRDEVYTYDLNGFRIMEKVTEKSGDVEGATQRSKEFKATNVFSDIEYKYSSVERIKTYQFVFIDHLGEQTFDWVDTDEIRLDGERKPDGSGSYRERVYKRQWSLALEDYTLELVREKRINIPAPIEGAQKIAFSRLSELDLISWIAADGRPAYDYKLVDRGTTIEYNLDIPPLEQCIPHKKCSVRLECVARDSEAIAAVGEIPSRMSVQWVMTLAQLEALARAEVERCAMCANINIETLEKINLSVGDTVTFEGRKYYITALRSTVQGTAITGVAPLRMSELVRLRAFSLTSTGWATLEAIRRASRSVDNVRMGTVVRKIDNDCCMVRIDGIGEVFAKNYSAGDVRTGDKIALGRATGKGGA